MKSYQEFCEAPKALLKCLPLPKSLKVIIINLVCSVTWSSPALCSPLRTVARQALLFMGFSRQEYWSGLPFPPPGDLPDSGTELASPASQADSFVLSHWGRPQGTVFNIV